MRKDEEHVLIPGPDIDFNEIRDLFDPTVWDVGYLNQVGFQRASASPVKAKFHLYGYDATNIHSGGMALSSGYTEGQ